MSGVPIEEGSIVYTAGGSNAGVGGKTQITKGKYSIQGLPQGTVKFTFSALAETGEMIKGAVGEMEPEKVNIVSEEFRINGIVREVSESGVQDFDLADGGSGDSE